MFNRLGASSLMSRAKHKTNFKGALDVGKTFSLDGELEERFERAQGALLANPFDPQAPGLAHLAPGHAQRDQAYEQLEQALADQRALNLSKKAWSRAARLSWALSLYPQLIDDLDEHIAQPPGQEQELEWAKAAFTQLRRWLDRHESAWWLGLFYQWRRAWCLLHEQLVGSGPSMQRLRATVWSCCFGPSLQDYERGLWKRLHHIGVWIEGEPGAGHEHVARVLAGSGWRGYDERRARFEDELVAGEELIVIELEGLTPLEQEALLFGHRKGALLPKSSVGALERAQPGQLIWIEGIEHASGALQVALARAQQRREFTPAGSAQRLPLKARQVLSLKRQAADLIDEGALLHEAYYKLGACSIWLPPLRARLSEAARPLDELTQLIQALCTSLTDHSGADPEHIAQTITRDVMHEHAWPGNLHELAHAIAQVELLGSYHLSQKQRRAPGEAVNAQALATSLACGEISIKELTEGYCLMLYEQLGTYEAVAARTGLDRRTVKKYIHT